MEHNHNEPSNNMIREAMLTIGNLIADALQEHRLFNNVAIDVQQLPFHDGFCVEMHFLDRKSLFGEEHRTILRTFFTGRFKDEIRPTLCKKLQWDDFRPRTVTQSGDEPICRWEIRRRGQCAATEARKPVPCVPRVAVAV